MKKIIAILSFLLAGLTDTAIAQCTSTTGAYDLIVTGNVVLPPAGPQFLFGYVCSGGNLFDSTGCCTRFIHVEQGGVYEVGPMAYGFVYLKSGATFDAHGNTNFFGVAYEAGATILNYAGPLTLCTAVTFPSANCSVGISENQTETGLQVYPNPCKGFLTIDFPPGFENETISIFDITGKQVMKSTRIKELHHHTLDVSSLLPGMYRYRISGNTGLIKQEKFIVVR